MRRIALISCSKSKQNYPCPARELYAPSQLFSLSYQYAKKVADEVYVLSARYGLLAEEDVVAPYDLTLTELPEHRQRDWANYVLRQMGERFDLNRDVFVILAGRNYYKNLLPHLVHTTLPLGNLRIGPRLSFLEQELARLSRGDPPVGENEFDNGRALCVRPHRADRYPHFAQSPAAKIAGSLCSRESQRKYFPQKHRKSVVESGARPLSLYMVSGYLKAALSWAGRSHSGERNRAGCQQLSQKPLYFFRFSGGHTGTAAPAGGRHDCFPAPCAGFWPE